MSSAKTTTMPAAADADADTRPKILLHPVPIYDSPLAKGVSVGRVAVLLGLLAWGMDSLVADPASALQRALPVVAAVQAVYATLCIPPAGSASRAGKKPRPGEKTKKNDGSTSVISSVIVALVLSALTVPALYALLVLFGAPFLAHTAHTVLCAAHFALLAVFPVVHARGLDRSALVAAAGSLLAGTVLYGKRLAGPAVKAD